MLEAEDLTLTFDNAYTVFVAENGSGKTTGLFILQCLLKKDFAALLRYKSREISIKFRGAGKVCIPYSGLVPRQFDTILRRAIGVSAVRIPYDVMLRILNLAASGTYEEFRTAPEYRVISRASPLTSRVIYERLRNFMRHETLREDDLLSPRDVPADMKQVIELVTKHFPMHVIYLPTYRRIEQDLKSLLNVESEPAELTGFIHFGMRDIQNKINSVAEKIRDHFVLLTPKQVDKCWVN